MSKKSPFTDEERKLYRSMLTNKQFRQVYYRIYREINGDEVRQQERQRLRIYRRLKADGICEHHWNVDKLPRPLKKDSYTCHDLATMTSMDRLARVVNKITKGELMLTFNMDETDKQEMVR